MYFYIQELSTKRVVKGSSKEIIVGTKNVDGLLVNTYKFSDERFVRDVKKAYRITMHESYRENGKVKKRQWVVATLNYYEIAESIEDDLFDFDNGVYYKLLDKIYTITDTFEMSEDEKESLLDDLLEQFASKMDTLFNRITDEFIATEEGKTFVEHKKLIKKHKENRRKFMSENDALGLEYDVCYDIHGNLTNSAYLEKITKRKSSQQKEKNSNYNREENNYHNRYRSGSSVSYTENQKKILKQFYRVLGKTFHPDSNTGRDTSEQMKFLNKLKEDWGL